MRTALVALVLVTATMAIPPAMSTPTSVLSLPFSKAHSGGPGPRGSSGIDGAFDVVSFCGSLGPLDAVTPQMTLALSDPTPLLPGEASRRVTMDLDAFGTEITPDGDLVPRSRVASSSQTVDYTPPATLSPPMTGNYVASLDLPYATMPPAVDLHQTLTFKSLRPDGSVLSSRVSMVRTAILFRCGPTPPTVLPGFGVWCGTKGAPFVPAESVTTVPMTTSRGTTSFLRVEGPSDCDPIAAICTALGTCPVPCTILGICMTPCEGAGNSCATLSQAVQTAFAATTPQQLFDLYGMLVALYPTTPDVFPQDGDTAVLGQGTGNGQWCITVPTDSVAGSLDTGRTAVPTGTPPPSPATFAAVGDVRHCENDKAVIHQDSELVVGGYVFKEGEEGHFERNWWQFGIAAFACGATLVVDAALILSPEPVSKAAVWEAATATIGFCGTAIVAGSSWDPGWIRCGANASGAKFGGQSSASDMESLPTVAGLVDWALTSTSPDTQYVWFDANGEPLDTIGPSQPYMGIHDPVASPDYALGEGDCKLAAKNSEDAAREQVQSFGTVNGRSHASDASLSVELDLLPPVTLDDATQLSDELWWSPVFGLAVQCDDVTSCPLKLKVEATQCGLVNVKGGTPSEATYSFVGQPDIPRCEMKLHAEVAGTPTPPVSVPYLVLEMQYEGFAKS